LERSRRRAPICITAFGSEVEVGRGGAGSRAAGVGSASSRERTREAGPVDFRRRRPLRLGRHHLVTMKQTLKALEAKVAHEGHVLTEAQLAALERVSQERTPTGEFESECPRSCGPQDTLRRAYLPVNLYRHRREGGLCKALSGEDAHHHRRSAQRSTVAWCRSSSTTAPR
jgi:hypothetical protein